MQTHICVSIIITRLPIKKSIEFVSFLFHLFNFLVHLHFKLLLFSKHTHNARRRFHFMYIAECMRWYTSRKTYICISQLQNMACFQFIIPKKYYSHWSWVSHSYIYLGVYTVDAATSVGKACSATSRKRLPVRITIAAQCHDWGRVDGEFGFVVSTRRSIVCLKTRFRIIGVAGQIGHDAAHGCT